MGSSNKSFSISKSNKLSKYSFHCKHLSWLSSGQCYYAGNWLFAFYCVSMWGLISLSLGITEAHDNLITNGLSLDRWSQYFSIRIVTRVLSLFYKRVFSPVDINISILIMKRNSGNYPPFCKKFAILRSVLVVILVHFTQSKFQLFTFAPLSTIFPRHAAYWRSISHRMPGKS